jgi:Transposase and inactivated derivatives, IS5 family
MLWVHCMQLFYNLSDSAMEDSLYEIESMRRFAGLSLSGPIPDETTILNFRHLLERQKLGEALFKEVNRYLGKQGLMLKEGSIADATIIEAPTSTKNTDGERDPEMHQTKKGNEWHFGMKMHVGVDDIPSEIENYQ